MSILPMPTVSANRSAITRLTALWALSESGLGGLMFALKIPLTGFFVGGFAVLLIGLIAWYSRCNFRTIAQATMLVLIVKATVSPHSPPPAYLAVAFQGFLGALLFRSLHNFKLAALLLAILAMLESALQKVIMLTLVYGNSLWYALDKLFEGISKDFPVVKGMSFSMLIIALYLLIYSLWGVIIGSFSGKLPRLLLLQQHTAPIIDFFTQKHQEEIAVPVAIKRKGAVWKWLRYLLILLFIVGVFAFSDRFAGQKILYIIFRSIAAMLLLFFVLRPITTWCMQRWLQKQSNQRKQSATEILDLLPALRSYVQPSWQLARQQSAGWRMLRNFILNLLVLTLHEAKD